MRLWAYIMFPLCLLSFVCGIFYGYADSVKVKEYRKFFIPSCRYYYSAREQWGEGDYYDYKGRRCIDVIAEALGK